MKVVKSNYTKEREYIDRIIDKLKKQGLKATYTEFTDSILIPRGGFFNGSTQIKKSCDGNWKVDMIGLDDDLDEIDKKHIKIFEEIVKKEVILLL